MMVDVTVRGVTEGKISFFGQEMQQNSLAPSALSYLIDQEKPERIIEIGTGNGGLSLFLALTGLELITYDNNDRRQSPEIFDKLNIDFRCVDIFEKIEDLKKIIQKEGKTLLICDGGNKPKEFVTLAPFLKSDDIIIAHDYQYDKETWNWFEIDDSVLDGFNDLQKVHMDVMGKAAWLCCKKIGSIVINDDKKIVKPITVIISICTIRNPEVQQLASIQGTWFQRSDEVQSIISYEYGDASIARSRSTVATDFLDKTNGDMLLFIDDDILYDPKDVIKIAKDARDLNAIVCAPYRIKSTKDVRLALHPLEEEGVIAVGEDVGKIIEVKYASTGFMCIPRKILEDVAKTLPKVDGARGITEDGKPRLMFWPMFQEIWPEGQWLSEDYAFCHRARDLGYKVYIDSTIVLGHVGKVVFLPGEIRSMLG